jgi:hypothetical protein
MVEVLEEIQRQVPQSPPLVGPFDVLAGRHVAADQSSGAS